jgi:ADP-ribose pyrophosphatase YjhB (NUDIX family)
MSSERRDPTTNKPTYTAGAFAIARNGAGRVLWVRRRSNGRWGLPGGVIELGETPAEAVVRETREESGFDIEVVRLAVVDWRLEQADVVFAFECHVVRGQATTSDETSEVAFFDFAPSTNVAQRHVDRVRDVLDSPDRALLRST